VAARGWRDIELIQGDATQMSLGRTFDAILFAYSLSMIPDWRAALRRAHEHLQPGGRLAVLDFGAFRGWGPLAPLMRGWLRWNHVDTLQPYAEAVREVCGNAEVYSWCGGYNFTAVGRRMG
jgi:S-adenosylmethionine-diacylgycerolhomoserine-N-methlytransferase